MPRIDHTPLSPPAVRRLLPVLCWVGLALMPSCGSGTGFLPGVSALSPNVSRRSVVLNVLAPGATRPSSAVSGLAFGGSHVESADETVADVTGTRPFHFQTQHDIPVTITVTQPGGPVVGAVVRLSLPRRPAGVVFQGVTDGNGRVSGRATVAAVESGLEFSVFAGGLEVAQGISLDGVQSLERRIHFRQPTHMADIADADGDRVPDDLDAFPHDPGRAAVIAQPASILAFDESGPAGVGDSDFNDLVMGVRSEHTQDAGGRVVEARSAFRVLARGTETSHDIFLALPGSGQVDFAVEDETGKVLSDSQVRLASLHSIPLFPRSPFYFESHDRAALFSSADLCPHLCNVDAGGTITSGYRSTITVMFARPLPQEELPMGPPALVLAVRARGMNGETTGAPSVPAAPAAVRQLGIPEEWNWPVEGATVAQAYPQFDSWVASRGHADADWYQHAGDSSDKKLFRYYTRSPIAAYFLQFGLTHRSLLWAFIAVILAGLIALLFLKERTENEL